MCGRYSLAFDDRFFDRYQTVNTIEFAPRYNVAPSQIMPIVLHRSPNRVELMMWGFVPRWENKRDKPKAFINLRDDTVATKAWAKPYLQSQRCLVPATGFFEWQKTATGKKIPYYIRLKTGAYFSFAGLYNTYPVPRTGQQINTFAILTTEPNALMAPIHGRMPVMLAKDEEEAWLNPDLVEVDQLKAFLHPYPDEKMEAYPVSPRVNYPANDRPDVLTPRR